METIQSYLLYFLLKVTADSTLGNTTVAELASRFNLMSCAPPLILLVIFRISCSFVSLLNPLIISVFDLPFVTIGKTGVAVIDAEEFLLGIAATFAAATFVAIGATEVAAELPGLPKRLVMLGFSY